MKCVFPLTVVCSYISCVYVYMGRAEYNFRYHSLGVMRMMAWFVRQALSVTGWCSPIRLG